MNSLVLDMPVAAPVQSPPLPIKLQERLTTVYDGVFATLSNAYTIPEPHEVFAFLRQYSELIPVLQEGRAVVSFFFGDETPVTLTTLRDPDLGFDYLVAWIGVKLPSAEASDKLFDLTDTWLRTRAAVVGDRLSFSLGGL